MIWCVEDDSGIRDIELYALNSVGFETRGFEDGLSAWDTLQTEQPDLIILDVMLPEMDGMELLSKMKASDNYIDIPVILVTAKGQEYDLIHGLELGADDYIVKPFSVMEMVARVKAVLRRSQPQAQKSENLLSMGGLIVNLDQYTVAVDDVRITLTHKEFELLRLFLSSPGRVFSREQLFQLVWKYDYIGDSRTLDSHIRSLRHKLNGYGQCIETIRGVGYRWEDIHDK